MYSLTDDALFLVYAPKRVDTNIFVGLRAQPNPVEMYP